jgi:hypothetical protein
MVFAEPQSLGPIKVFLADNLGADHPSSASGSPCDYFSTEAANRPCAGYSPAHASPSRFSVSHSIPTGNAAENFESILANAGATLPCRDSLDSRIAEEVATGTGRHASTPGRLPALDTCQ